MKLADISKKVTSYVNALKREGHKLQHTLIRASLDDVKHWKDEFHLGELRTILAEMQDPDAPPQSEKTLRLLADAITTVTDEMER